MKTRNVLLCATALFFCGNGLICQAQETVKPDGDAAAESNSRFLQSLILLDDLQTQHEVLSSRDSDKPKPSKYWLGILCVDATTALRSQLGIETGVGLVVDAVTDGSPAKMAGILENDVLVSVRPVSASADQPSTKLIAVISLVEVVESTEANPLRFELFRKGMKQTVEMTPSLRRGVGLEKPLDTSAEAAKRAVLVESALVPTAETAAAQTLSEIPVTQYSIPVTRYTARRYLGPMVRGEQKAPPLPEGLLIEFHQIVGQPEKITVTQGDRKWDILVKELDNLPEEIRMHVQQQLKARNSAITRSFTTVWQQPQSDIDNDFATRSKITVYHPVQISVQNVKQTTQDLQTRIEATLKELEQARIQLKRAMESSARESQKLSDRLDRLKDQIEKSVQNMEKPTSGATSSNPTVK